jgi:EAL and modified HD-GYP domain-containing signal transduction protein
MSITGRSPLSDALIGYSPIVGRHRNAIATRLSFMGKDGQALSGSRICEALGRIWPDTATPVLVDMGDDSPDATLLDSEVRPMLWLEIPGRLAGDPGGLELIEALYRHGYTLVLRGRPAADLPPALLPAFKLALIHVDEDRRLGEGTAQAQRQVAKRSIPYAQTGVQSIELMGKCFDTGAEAVIGWPFRDALDHASSASSNPDFMTVSRLLQMIDNDDGPEAMEAEIRQDPALAFRLLRYINSPAFGLRVEVQSFRHALMMLGLKKLKKWLALLLSTSSRNANLRPVMFASFRRGLFLEHLVGDLDPEARDEMFILGVFSLLDKMFSEPFEELLGRLKLPDRVQESLVGSHGPYRPYLQIVEAVEQGPHPKLAGLLDNALVSLDRCNESIVRALTGPLAGEAA